MPVLILLLLFSLILPQLQEGLPEAYFGIVLLVVGIFAFRKRTVPIPQPVMTLWIWTLVGLVGTGILSVSRADSILTFIRYLEGYCFFLLGISLDPKRRAAAIHAFTGFPIVLTVIFILLWTVPALAAYLPVYNGLLAVNGHHPVAAYLVLLFPVAIYTSHNVKLPIVMILTTLALILSAARGAWLITIGFLTMTLITPYRRALRIKTIPVILFLVAASITGFWISQRPESQKTQWTEKYAALRFFTKDANGGMRAEFARQAIQAFWDSPLTGHGPGTFHLLSRAYAKTPAASGRHAHSFALETLAENGLIGSMPILLLFGAVLLALLRIARNDPSPGRRGLAWGVILTAVYSLVDVNFSALPLWNIVWLIIGILFTPLTRARPLPRQFQAVPFVIPALFAATYAASAILGMRSPARAFQVAPYRREMALAMIRTADRTSLSRMTPTIRFWFQKDPDILFSLALRDTTDISYTLFERAISRDPYNYAYVRQYFARLIHTSDTARLRNEICGLLIRHAGPAAAPACSYVRQRTEFETYLNHPDALLSAVNALSGSDGMAKFFYVLGLTLHDTTGDAAGTILFWTAAYTTDPQWGYYYLETAAAQYVWNSDNAAAQQTLNRCLSHPLAGHGCRTMATTPDQLFPPGTYARDISRIPAIQ